MCVGCVCVCEGESVYDAHKLSGGKGVKHKLVILALKEEVLDKFLERTREDHCQWMNIGIVSKVMLGKLLRDRVECI